MSEPQYQTQIDASTRLGPTEMGSITGQVWREDRRPLVFLLASYKFVSKMLEGKATAIEFGCGDGFGSRVVSRTVPSVHRVDFDRVFID